jgi:hypothetical protein
MAMFVTFFSSILTRHRNEPLPSLLITSSTELNQMNILTLHRNPVIDLPVTTCRQVWKIESPYRQLDGEADLETTAYLLICALTLSKSNTPSQYDDWARNMRTPNAIASDECSTWKVGSKGVYIIHMYAYILPLNREHVDTSLWLRKFGHRNRLLPSTRLVHDIQS